MWALFTESWGSWRSNYLNLSPIPFTDPVTNLPLWHVREESPLLLYGFSKEIVECPGQDIGHQVLMLVAFGFFLQLGNFLVTNAWSCLEI